MNDRIVLLTPMGQFLRSKQLEMGLTEQAMADFLRINRRTYKRMLTLPLEHIHITSIKKACRACGLEEPPQVPEDLSPLDSIVWPYDSKKKIHLARNYYKGLKQTMNAGDMQQFIVNFGNKLMTVLRKHCLSIMAMEIHSRASLAAPPHCILEIFSESKPFTKLRIVLSYGKASFFHCEVHEISQRDNTFVQGLIAETFSHSTLNSLITKIIPKFCDHKKETYKNPLDRVLAKK